MLLKLTKPSLLHSTTLVVILLQTLTTTHMLPISAPLRQTSELDLLIDPVYQAEQDNQESKRVVAKSVYNTVIRVTTTPCSEGSQRVKEGGPCVTRYTGSGPVLDEDFQLSILKGITSLGGIGGSRRPSQNKNRNRHRTTTTQIPTTTTATSTTVESEPPTTTWNTHVDEESPPSESEEVKKVGNMEVLDIEVDSSHHHIQPEFSPTPAMSSSIITSSISLSIPAPKQGPRPTMVTTSTSDHTTNGNENVESEMETILPETDEKVTKLSPSTITQPIVISTTVSPTKSTTIIGTKDDDDEKTTDTIIDFSTTIISIKGEDEIINVAFDVNPTEEPDEQEDDMVTEEQPSSHSWVMGQNVMAKNNMHNKEEDEVVSFPKIGPGSFGPISNSSFIERILITQHPDPVTITQLDPAVMSSNGSISESVTSSEQFPLSAQGLLSPSSFLQTEFNPVGSSTSSLSGAPVTHIIPRIPNHLPEINSLTSNITTIPETQPNFTESEENNATMKDGNTRLPDLNGSQTQNTEHVQRISTQDFSSTDTFITKSPTSSTFTSTLLQTSASPSSTLLPKMIQINDSEIDPTHINLHHTSSKMMDDEVKVAVGDGLKSRPHQDHGESLLTSPNSDETEIQTTKPDGMPTSLAQEILSRLRPISKYDSVEQVPPQIDSNHKISGITPEVFLDAVESNLRNINNDQSREAEIDRSHHRSRSRNRARNSEISLTMPSHQRQFAGSVTIEDIDGGPMMLFPSPAHHNVNLVPATPSNKMLVASSSGLLDYSRLGDKYRRFRVF